MPPLDKDVESIDAYIESFPEDVQKKLEELRRTIKEVAPEAEETISYRMPTFKLQGNLVHFAAFENHIGFYPTSSGIDAFEDELSEYKIGKGSVRFPLDEPVPYDLVREIVEYREAENTQNPG